MPWKLDNSCYYGAIFNADPEAFIFSVTHQMVFPVRGEDAVINHQSFGPTYGDDISILDQCNKNEKSYSVLGHTYQVPDGI